MAPAGTLRCSSTYCRCLRNAQHSSQLAAVERRLAGEGAARAAGTTTEPLPPGLPCKLRFSALLSSALWAFEKEHRCGKHAGVDPSRLAADSKAIEAALVISLLFLERRRITTAQAVLDAAFEEFGLDWTRLDRAYQELPKLYGPRWWQTGGRRCWDELAVLPRLVTDRSGLSDALLADFLNGFTNNRDADTVRHLWHEAVEAVTHTSKSHVHPEKVSGNLHIDDHPRASLALGSAQV
ncbi:hypothetical protein ABPG75_011396 [Micractinium tetrahymenae]